MSIEINIVIHTKSNILFPCLRDRGLCNFKMNLLVFIQSTNGEPYSVTLHVWFHILNVFIQSTNGEPHSGTLHVWFHILNDLPDVIYIINKQLLVRDV